MILQNIRVLSSKCFVPSRWQSKLSYAFGVCSESLRTETMPQVLNASVRRHPDRLAIVSMHQGIEKTYQQLGDDVSRFAIALKGLGVAKGDRVGIWSTNCYEWVVTQFATAKLGAILVNVNPSYRDKELSYCLNLVGCHTLISSQQYKSTNYVEILERASPGITNTTGFQVASSTIPSLTNLVYIDANENVAPSSVTRFSELLDKAKPSSAADCHIEMDDVSNIQFTSGTTGKPKGAALSHFNYVNNAHFVLKRMFSGLSDPIICMPNPMYHTMGSILGTFLGLMCGSTVVCPAPSPVPSKSIEAIEKYSCNVVYGTPTMYVDILNSPEVNNRKLDSVKTAIMSGAPCPAELARRLRTKFTNLSFVCIPYGATELSPGATVPEKPDDIESNLNHVGTVLDHTELKLVDLKGCTVPRGTSGEVLARGHNVMLEYWDQEEKTKEAIDNARWYHTGDIGVMAEDGTLSIVGRIKDLIIRGGENIYPREVEDALVAHPQIADISIVGVPDERFGEELCACVIMKPGFADLNSKDIRDFLHEKITHFKIPRYVLIMDEFPRTATMKVQKNELKEIASSKLGLTKQQ
ncbi:Medium-chain acyl-CoA ligase ACSF2, mitochondrial [Halotydeus destructor]|nr:Medium-chain acyl-CoA ligase ACSF2, mitochondrial [Halotydeus destructor]